MDALQLRDNARFELEQIKTIETGVEYLNKVKAIETWAKAEKKDAELQNMIAEQKIRTQRILGRLLRESELDKGGGNVKNHRSTRLTSEKPQLKDYGITKYQSSTFQKIADIPEPAFEGFIEEKKTAVDNAVSELTTAGILAFAKGKPHVSNNSGENEWYTPPCYIESARFVMGSIDTDPATSEKANQTVNAKTYYTKETNGLVKEWTGNVWLNPPYAQPLISDFADAVVNKRTEYNQAIILVNNATDTQWLNKMMNICDCICFIVGRVKFIDMDGNPSGAPLQGQCVIYIGDNIKAFKNEFKKYGLCFSKI